MNILNDFKRRINLEDKVQVIIIINIIVFVLLYICSVMAPVIYHSIFPYLALVSEGWGTLSRFWTIVSYSFLHANIWHLLLNMIMLFFVSNLFATFFSQKQFLTIYFLGAFGGGLFYFISSFFLPLGSALVGASAAVMAPLIGLAYYAPQMKLRFALIGKVKMIYIAIFIIIIDLFQLSSSNLGGHLAHLGGACLGLLYMIYLKQEIIVQKTKKKNKNKTHLKTVYVNKHTKENELHSNEAQIKIDQILDKISKSGYDSLTKQEKDFLFRQGNK